jgi:hypothetical protein
MNESSGAGLQGQPEPSDCIANAAELRVFIAASTAMNDNRFQGHDPREAEPAVDEQWYYEQHAVPHGPLAGEQLQQLVHKGAIEPTTLVWREGLAEWMTAEAAGFIAAPARAVPPPLPVPPPVVAGTLQSGAPQVSAPRTAAPAVSDVRTGHRPVSPAAMNWPLVIGGGAAALLVAVALGWFANAMLNQQPEPRQVAVAAPESHATANRAETNPLLASPSRPPAPPPVQIPPAPPTAPAVISSPPAPAPAAPASSTATSLPATTTPPAVTAAPTAPTTQPMPSVPSTLAPPNLPQPNGKPQTLYQEIDVQRQPKFSILGSVTAQDLHYQMLSELRVGVPDDKGLRKIEQYVRDTKLLKADELSQGMFEGSLRDLVGWQFTFQVNRRGDIMEWKGGPPAGRKAAKVERGAELGFMVTSVMDEDGWKEMAQLSFFVPEEQTAGSQTWVRKMTHDFGPLGSWAGETHYTPKEGQGSAPLQIDYVHKMAYKPPDKGIGGLPFTVSEANFKPEIAAGTFHYDKQAGRVIQVQERFLVKGNLAIDLVGQAAAVEMEEDQLITVRMLERNPWEQ